MTITDYRNFDLLIIRSGNSYRAFVVDAPGGEASLTIDLPVEPDALAELASAGMLRGTRRNLGAADTARSQAPDLADQGRRLFDAVFRDAVGTVLAISLNSVAQEGRGLRIRLRFEEDAADLASLPWEILYDPNQGQFLGLGERSPIVRYLSLARSRSTLLVEPPLRVLAVLASAKGLALLDMDREWQAIQDALTGLVAEGKFELERLAIPSLTALQERLLGDPVHILHFVGHGVFDEASQQGSLALEDASGRVHLVPGARLAEVLHNHSSLRLAYLNACEGAIASAQSVFTGVAQQLVQGGVPATVAMQAEISDRGAIELARTFYSALASGRPVDAALTQARVALSAAGSQEWAKPVLFSRSPDNRLFDIREVLPTPDCPYPGMTPFTEEQQQYFFGRDREVEEAVERLRQHPFLAVVGPSGSGKSSLICAGVIPALRTSRRFGPGEWSVRTVRPGQHPLAALETALPIVARDPEIGHTLLFVDQFEEVFTLAEASEAHAFIDALEGLIGQTNVYILVTVRADFYPDLMASSLWKSIKANRLELTPLGDDELWAAIVQPAAQMAVAVDEALAVQLIADAAGESGVLPLVQETLVLLWDRVERRELKLAAYRQMADGGRNGLQVAIDRRANVVYENLPQEAQPIAQRIFLRLVQFGEGRADTRRQQTVKQLQASGDDPALFHQTLAALTADRLLTASGEANEDARRVDIGHEALITGWPRLQGWLSKRKNGEIVRRRLEDKAQDWVRLGRGQGGLLDEAELAEANDWLADPITKDLGSSDDLRTLVEVSRKTINPGWHRTGTVGLVAGGLTLAAFLAWMYLWLVLNRTPGTARLPLLVFILVLIAAIVFAFVQSRKSDPYLLQRASNKIARQRRSGLGITACAVMVATLWASYAGPRLAVDKTCRALGYENDTPVAMIALINQDVDPVFVEAFRVVLQLESRNAVRVYIATLDNSLVCKQYFRHRMMLHSEAASNVSEIVITVDVFKSTTGKQLETARAFGPETCRLYGFAARKAAQVLGYDVAARDEESELPGPLNCEAYIAYEEGDAAIKRMNYQDAEAAFLRAISLSDGYATAHAKLGTVYYSTGRYREGIQELETAVALSEDKPFAPFLVHLARACYRAGDMECAMNREREAIVIDSRETHAYEDLAMIYRESGDFNSAHALLEQYEAMSASGSSENQPAETERFLARHRGILAYYEGDWGEATRLLEQANEMGDSEEQEIIYYLAKSAAQQGQNAKACQYWRRYDDLSPGDIFRATERKRDANAQMKAMGC